MVKIKTHGLSKEEKIKKYSPLIPEWQELRKQGYSYIKIGKQYHVDKNDVSKLLNEKKVFINVPTFLGGIYRIVCNINNRIYIGASYGLRDREVSHFNALKKNKHKNKTLQQDYNLYGKENFEFDVIEIIDPYNKEFAAKREQHFMDLYKVLDKKYGYNDLSRENEHQDLGKRNSHVFSEEHKAKLKIARNKRKTTPGMLAGLQIGRDKAISQRKYNHLKNEWTKLRNSGLTWKEISIKYNINISIIRKYVNRKD